MSSSEDDEALEAWEEIGGLPHWEFVRPSSSEEFQLLRAAIDGLNDGELTPLATYLIEAKTLVMPLSLRQWLIGLTIGSKDWGHRLVLDKHPDLARKPTKRSSVRKTQERDYQVENFFIEGNGAEKFEAGVAYVIGKMGLPRGTITTIISSEKRARAVEAFDAGLDKKRQREAMLGSFGLSELIWQQRRDDLLLQLEQTSDENLKQLLGDEFNEHMDKSPFRRS